MSKSGTSSSNVWCCTTTADPEQIPPYCSRFRLDLGDCGASSEHQRQVVTLAITHIQRAFD